MNNRQNLINVVKGRPVVFVGMNYYDRWKNKSELRGGWRRFAARRRQRSVSVVHQVTSRKIQTQWCIFWRIFIYFGLESPFLKKKNKDSDHLYFSDLFRIWIYLKPNIFLHWWLISFSFLVFSMQFVFWNGIPILESKNSRTHEIGILFKSISFFEEHQYQDLKVS